jgi:hypothetical protein
MKFGITLTPLVGLAIGMAVFALPSPSSAGSITVTDATWQAVLDVSASSQPSKGTGIQTTSGTASNSAVDSSSSVTANLTTALNGSLNAATSTTYDKGDASVTAYLDEYFKVVLKPGMTSTDTSVPIVLGGSGTITQSVVTGNTASLSLNSSSGSSVSIGSACADTAASCALSGYTHQLSFGVSEVLSVAINGPGNVGPYDLHGILSIYSNGLFISPGQTDSQSGSLDPFAFIDPTFSDAPDFELVFSPNVGNFAPTPLPAALPLFAGGLGIMGLFGRRRKRKNAAAIAV